MFINFDILAQHGAQIIGRHVSLIFVPVRGILQKLRQTGGAHL